MYSRPDDPIQTKMEWPAGVSIRVIVSFLASALLFIFSLSLFWQSRDAMAYLPSQSQVRKNQHGVVDVTPWLSAEALANLAGTAEEQGYAREAERLADHDVDRAFAFAIRQAEVKAEHPKLDATTRVLAARVAELQKLVEQGRLQVRELSKSTSSDDELELAKGKLTLDTDDLDEARRDLARLTGDEREEVQQELSSHEAEMKKYDEAVRANTVGAVIDAERYDSLLDQARAWFEQRKRARLLQEAADQSARDERTLADLHKSMEQDRVVVDNSAGDKASRLRDWQKGARFSQMLSILDDRVVTKKQLETIYRQWSDQVAVQHRIAFHLAMKSLAILALIVLIAILADALLTRFLKRSSVDRMMNRVHLLSRLCLHLLTAGGLLLVIFGVPHQIPTILGLATAGLTVVLQDFIVGFCGWFVLMGKNGIRPGDWVEIDGVGGEVVDISVFRTTLLETGNWTDHGHPTGRRITFSNSFAIKGHYFNFTTNGQWMWDEIKVTVASSDAAYESLELIHKVVLEETEQESNLAEEEWQRLGRAMGSGHYPAVATVSMRPSGSGIDIIIRYVTRASTRFKTRNVIYQSVIELLHKPTQAKAIPA